MSPFLQQWMGLSISRISQEGEQTKLPHVVRVREAWVSIDDLLEPC